MKIFYTASFYGKKKYQKYYDLVLGAIRRTKAKLISTEEGSYTKLLTDSEKRRLGSIRAIHYEAVKKGIQTADAVIIEISSQDFQLGHEATLAIQSKKPVLCLSMHEDMSEKIRNKYFHGAKYSELNVGEIISEFVKKSSKRNLTERFNMFLSPAQVASIDKKAKEKRISRSEYVRELIESALE
jgi:hypothetical protein